MKPIIATLTLFIFLGIHLPKASARTDTETEDFWFGAIERVDLPDSMHAEVTYYLIEDFSYYMNSILDDGKTIDIKTNNKARHIRFTLNKKEDGIRMRQMFMKDGFNVLAVEIGAKRTCMVLLGFRKFIKERYIYFKDYSER